MTQQIDLSLALLPNEEPNQALNQTLNKMLVANDFEYIETIQMLWSGYGQLARFGSESLAQTVIAKHILPPSQIEHSHHPRGWGGELSHQRKLSSYRVEAQFYQTYSEQCSKACRVPELLASTDQDGQQLLVLEDLDQAGYFIRPDRLSVNTIKVVIGWLANFHACFLDSKAHGLWQTGCYWHLATRPQELANMPESQLKQSAPLLDEKLQQAKFQTLVHGDAKLANFCFHHDSIKVAAVDFQYIGQGVGVKDLSYFLGSCMSEQALFKHDNNLLEYYFAALKSALIQQGKKGLVEHFSELECEWRRLYSIAWADFHRFLAGWCPEHKKINAYMAQQTELALSLVNNSK